MTEHIERSPQRIAAALLHLSVQLDDQLYGRLYDIKPISFHGRLHLFCFAFVTCRMACAADLGPEDDEVKTKATALCVGYLLDHYKHYFPAQPGHGELKATFQAITAQYDLSWKMAAGRLEGSEAPQAHAVLRRSLGQILFGNSKEADEEPLIMNQVHDLVAALPKIRAAF